ncbi:MAG: hypothetical protein ACJ8HQ_06920, partial [Chthoniobacterales bacterium]
MQEILNNARLILRESIQRAICETRSDRDLSAPARPNTGTEPLPGSKFNNFALDNCVAAQYKNQNSCNHEKIPP